MLNSECIPHKKSIQLIVFSFSSKMCFGNGFCWRSISLFLSNHSSQRNITSFNTYVQVNFYCFSISQEGLRYWRDCQIFHSFVYEKKMSVEYNSRINIFIQEFFETGMEAGNSVKLFSGIYIQPDCYDFFFREEVVAKNRSKCSYTFFPCAIDFFLFQLKLYLTFSQ